LSWISENEMRAHTEEAVHEALGACGAGGEVAEDEPLHTRGLAGNGVTYILSKTMCIPPSSGLI